MKELMGKFNCSSGRLGINMKYVSDVRHSDVPPP